MYLKTSNKKQLAAAVTLAVMGMAWVAVPSQVWAADGGFGAINNPDQSGNLRRAKYEWR